MPFQPTYDETFKERAREAGASVQCLWQMRDDEQCLRLECLAVNGILVIVQTFVDPDGNTCGWEVYSSAPTNNIDESVTDALQRAGAA